MGNDVVLKVIVHESHEWSRIILFW